MVNKQGSELVEGLPLLANAKLISLNVEQIFNGHVDVAVTDGLQAMSS
jgi:hypothetical protein